MRMTNSLVIIVVWAINACSYCSFAAEEAILREALRTRPLGDVINDLNKGLLPAPSFTEVKQLDPNANDIFLVIMDALKRERKIARDHRFTGPEYPDMLVRTHKYFDKYDSYVCLLVVDNVRRMMLEWAQATLLLGHEPFPFSRIQGVVDSVRLSPGRLTVLHGDHPPENPVDTQLKGDELSVAAQQLWQSRGYNAISEGFVGTGQILNKYIRGRKLLTSELVAEYAPIDLAFRILNTEELFRVFLAGSLAFLNRGGDISKVSESNTEYFDSIMPPETARQYEMSVLGRKSFGPFALLLFFGKVSIPGGPSDSDAGVPWMSIVFR